MDKASEKTKLGKRRFLLALSLVLLLSCEAERINPLDPKSPLYRDEGTLVGKVNTRTGKAIPDVIVEVPSLNRYAITDSTGRYEFEKLKSGDANVYVSLSGYSSDSGHVKVRILKVDTLNFVMDILPQFDHCCVRTYNTLNKNNQVEFEASVSDGDGIVDIDSVLCWVDEILDTFKMDYAGGVYKKTIQAKALPGQTLESLVGKDVFFIAYDKAGQNTCSKPAMMTRIIDEIPSLVEPVNFQVVGKNPTLVWNKTLTSFPYTYKVEVMNTQLGAIWTREGVPSKDTTIVVDEELEADDYSWVIWIIDEYGNRSRSLIAGFKVK